MVHSRSQKPSIRQMEVCFMILGLCVRCRPEHPYSAQSLFNYCCHFGVLCGYYSDGVFGLLIFSGVFVHATLDVW